MFKIFIGMIFISNLVFADYLDTWNAILKDHVSKGIRKEIELSVVDYKGVAGDTRWDTLIEEIENYDTSSLKGNEYKAFWINAYNIGAIKMVVDNYPVKSIKDIGNLINPVWDKDIITIDSKTYSLGYIEHKILRKTGDADIHYAIVCASLSCPDLRLEPYYATKLKAQLEEQKQIFLSNNKKGVSIVGKTYYISSLFKWYKDDFGTPKKYLGIPDENKIKYLKYDWSLNE